MKKTIELKEKCMACNGTGIYVGMAERDGAGVVCYKCKGTGCFEYSHTYEDFEKREERKDVLRVYQVNPGICIGCGNGHTLEEFGGMSYEEWKNGKRFEKGMEDRAYTCPCWWYQSADYKQKPEWDECKSSLGSTFSRCKNFQTKAKCWERFDKETESK